MSYDQEHMLVDLIQHYPFLYDKSLKEYKDVGRKDLAWEAISAAMAITGMWLESFKRDVTIQYGLFFQWVMLKGYGRIWETGIAKKGKLLFVVHPVQELHHLKVFGPYIGTWALWQSTC